MNWNMTVNTQPDDNTLCDTLSENGLQQELMYYKGLWFYPDKSMYVYYTPKFWKAI